MWFRLAKATFNVNLGTMESISKSYMMDYSGLTGLSASPGSVSYASDSTPDATITFTVKSGYVFKSGSKVTASGGASKTYTASTDIAAGSSFTMALTGINNKVTFVGAAELTSGGNTGGSGGNKPGTPVNYTFTINPTPTSATVTLTASGYSTVSGTGSKSITVANGTKVNWRVSADGYITQSGSKSITRGEALSIVLNQSGTVDTWYTNYAIGPAKDGTNIAKANYAGFAYQGANDDNYIGVPINAVRLRVAQAGTMTIGIVNKSDLKTIVSSQTITLTNPSISNVQEYRLSEQITLTSGQLLMFGAQGDTGLFYYKESGTATPANGECMYNNLGTANAKRASSSASLTVDAGFLI